MNKSYIYAVMLLIIAPLMACADASQVLYARMHYSRSGDSLTLQRLMFRDLDLPVSQEVSYPAFLVHTIDGSGVILGQTTISSPMYISVPPDETGGLPEESRIEVNESVFSILIQSPGTEALIRVYEVDSEHDETPSLIGEVILP